MNLLMESVIELMQYNMVLYSAAHPPPLQEQAPSLQRP